MEILTKPNSGNRSLFQRRKNHAVFLSAGLPIPLTNNFITLCSTTGYCAPHANSWPQKKMIMQMIFNQLLRFPAPQSENLEVQSIQICTFSRSQNSSHAGSSSSWSTTTMLLWSISPEFSPIAPPNHFTQAPPQGLNFQKPTYDKRRPQNFPLV